MRHIVSSDAWVETALGFNVVWKMATVLVQPVHIAFESTDCTGEPWTTKLTLGTWATVLRTDADHSKWVVVNSARKEETATLRSYTSNAGSGSYGAVGAAPAYRARFATAAENASLNLPWSAAYFRPD